MKPKRKKKKVRSRKSQTKENDSTVPLQLHTVPVDIPEPEKPVEESSEKIEETETSFDTVKIPKKEPSGQSWLFVGISHPTKKIPIPKVKNPESRG